MAENQVVNEHTMQENV